MITCSSVKNVERLQQVFSRKQFRKLERKIDKHNKKYKGFGENKKEVIKIHKQIRPAQVSKEEEDLLQELLEIGEKN